MNKIYTIGHSSHDLQYFLSLLKLHNINTIVDIRSVPFSNYVPHFNKDIIKSSLNKNNILCIYMGIELGINQENLMLYTNNILDYNKVIVSPNFTTGIERLKNGIFKGYNIAIMCTEKDPIDCHRSILIGEILRHQNYSVLHILPDGRIESHDKFLNRLIEIYYPDSHQQSIFQLINANYNIDLIDVVCRRRYSELISKL